MLYKFERIFVRSNQILIGLMMALIFIFVFTDVIGRYCFGISLGTSEEISTFLMVWITYLGADLAMWSSRCSRTACRRP